MLGEALSRFLSLARAAPKILLEGFRTLADRLRGAPDRPNQALAWVRTRAREGDPRSVLAALDEYAREHRFLMNVGDRKGVLLLEELDRALSGVREPRVLELGCYCGYSAILMASRLGHGGRLTSVEIDESSVRAASEIVRFAGLSERVTVLQGAAQGVIPTLTGPFHFVLLDHWKDRYLDDLLAIERCGLLAPGSVVFADNVGEVFGVRAYLDYVRASERFASRHVDAEVEYTELPDAVEISVFRG
jgi:catechol O-methyltransferase